MEQTENVNKAAGAPSGLNVGLDDFPHITPGQIGWGTLRNIIEWEQRCGIGNVSQKTLDFYREEGYSAAQTGLELGLIDYGQASGDDDC